ncbi:ParA family protein [Fortiea sp. LEGE XX443]|uniref:ParA family protein n=1 Tax=Fortiea sp. LEGE XX443 TaxID=1828611 RepID=UPI00187F497D|nr:ParA family protein [Fortiea sp. LEGE XX443]MBE9006868.1 ParA family protein [Fortiea sp. LEGE XX443]
MAQVVIAALATVGGVGKSTISVHLADKVSKGRQRVAILDLDPQRSLDVFCGFHTMSNGFYKA